MSDVTKPWLSVVLPVHNGEAWILAAMESLASQADPGIEVVVIDTSDGPGTRKIIEQFQDLLAIRFIDPQGAAGCTAKTNLGVQQASSAHIAWLCQDDVWLPGRTAAVRRWIEQDPEAVLHLGPSAIIDKTGKELGIWRCPVKPGGVPLSQSDLLERLLVQNFVGVVSVVVRRDAWLAAGGIDPDLWYTGDWDLWIKLASRGQTCVHPETTGGFRIHDQSATALGSVDTAEFVRQHRLVVDRHMDLVSADKAPRVRSMAEASWRINAGLAASAAGRSGALFDALIAAIRLGPVKLARYINYSRIFDRSIPRLRAKLAGVI